MKGKIIRALEGCGLPTDALSDCARVMLTGRRSVAIEGERGVIELSPQRIRLRTGDGILNVDGSALELHALSASHARITGERIDAVSYQSP